MRRSLSGIQPSGKLHIGNYFGAVRQYIALQEECDAFYFIADYHAMTTVIFPWRTWISARCLRRKLRQNSRSRRG